MRHYSILLAVMAAWASIGVLHAGPTSDSEPLAWESLHPKINGYDWVQLTSGEWLKGEIKYLQNDVLSFDSDKLDLQSIDFEDVKQLYGRRRMNIALTDGSHVAGMVEIHGKAINVMNNGMTLSFGRERLLGMVSERLSERDRWSGKLALGLDLRRGNTRQLDFTSSLNLKRRTAASRFLFDYLGTTTYSSEVLISDSRRINTSYDIFVTRRFFMQPIFGEYFSDVFQNIHHRVSAGAGLGYELIDTGTLTWNVSGGLGVLYIQYVDVEPGLSPYHTSPVGVLRSHLDYDVTGDVEFIWDYKMNLLDEIAGRYTHHMVSTLETEFIADFTIDFSVIWDRVEHPTRREDGTIPYRDDLRTTLNIGYKF